MLGRYATFSFELDKTAMKHLKEKSYYNHNYYELDLNVYGDYITPAMCDILYEEFEEFSETYTYSLGYFEGPDFVRCFTWTEMEPKYINTIIEGN
jgi:hypothetical protein